MLEFTLKRLATLVVMMVAMSVLTFVIIQAPPGSYIDAYIMQESASNQGLTFDREALTRQFGLDKPMHIQYFKWVWGILHGNLGWSMEWQKPVTELIGDRIWMTLILGVSTVLFTWTLAIPIGIISAIKQYSIIDYVFTFLSYLGVGTPNFLLALMILYFSFAWFDIKISGLFSIDFQDEPWSFGKFIDMLKHIWVPMLILGTDGTARFTRIIRANLLDELNKPYVETARAKGLSEAKVILKYPTRIAIMPFISTAGWQLPQLFSGSLIVATVMSLPTVGPVLLRSLFAQDMYLAGSVILILTVLTMIGTFISDITLALMDPRIRMEA